MTEIDLQANLDDRVSLAAFAELWWAEQRPDSEDMAQFVANKQAAIRMLRKNHRGFPPPVTASGRTHLFRLGDLAGWAVSTQKPPSTPEEAARQRSPLVGEQWHLDRAIDACVVELGPDLARRLAVLTAVGLDHAGVAPGLSKLPARVRSHLEEGSGLSALLRWTSGRSARASPGLVEAVEVLLSGVPASAPSPGRLVRAMAAAILAGQTAADVADHGLDRCDNQASDSSQQRTGDSLAMLMLATGQPRRGEHIVDLAAGEARLLVAAANYTDRTASLTGVELEPLAWAIGCCRLYLHGLTADFRRGDSLTASVPTGDLVLVDPPIDKRREYVRWLTAAIGACTDGGRAVVALPALAAEPGRREWSGVGLRHCSFLVKCPARLRMDRGAALAIWGLEENPPENVLVVDASRLGMTRAALHDIGGEDADDLRDLLDRWRRTGRYDTEPPLEAGVFPRADYPGLPAEIPVRAMRTRLDDPPRLRKPMVRESRADIGDAMTQALELAEQLGLFLDDELRPYTAEQHRRAIQGLTQRLRAQLQTRETQEQVIGDHTPDAADRLAGHARRAVGPA